MCYSIFQLDILLISASGHAYHTPEAVNIFGYISKSGGATITRHSHSGGFDFGHVTEIEVPFGRKVTAKTVLGRLLLHEILNKTGSTGERRFS